MLDPKDGPIFGTKDVGSRYATQVKVVNNGAFDGHKGVIVKVYDRTAIVRLHTGPRAGLGLAFGLNELERVSE